MVFPFYNSNAVTRRLKCALKLLKHLSFIFIEHFIVYNIAVVADAGLEIVHCVDLVLMQI